MFRICMSFFFFGIPLFIAQFVFIGALSMCKNHGVLTMINFTTIAYSSLVSYFRYGETINNAIMVGIVFVFAGVWQAIYYKNH